MRWSSLAVPVLVTSLLLSGCFSGGQDDDAREGTQGTGALPDISLLSQPIFDILPVEEVWVTASDAVVGETGTRLHNAVYRPDTAEPVPIFINFSPYWDDSATLEGDAFSQYMIHEYVPRGYAVVLSAIRGTGHSEGCFEVASDRESQDVNEVVDFFANADWSNGNIAAGGKSYDSTSQNGMIAKFPHAALKGLFHVSGITDMYSYTFAKGTPARADSAAFTTSYGVGQSAGEYAGGAANAGSVDDDSPDSLARLAGEGCADTPEGVANAGASTAVGAKTPYWVERDWTRDIATSSWNGSIFFVHGLQDWNVQPSHILPWIDQVNANGGIEVLGWLHQWADQDEYECEPGNGHVYPMRSDWNETMLRWMDGILKGKQTGLDQMYGYDIQDTECQWRHLDAWPPTEGIGLTGVSGGSALDLGDGPVHITGSVRIDVTATASIEDPVITATLYDEGDGDRTWVGEAVLRAVFRDSLEQPSPVPPNQAIVYHLETYPLDHVVAEGHRLVIQFGEDPQHSVVTPSQTGNVAVPSVDFGPVPTPGVEERAPVVTYGTADVHLPTGSLDLIDPQPEWIQCFAC